MSSCFFLIMSSQCCVIIWKCISFCLFYLSVSFFCMFLTMKFSRCPYMTSSSFSFLLLSSLLIICFLSSSLIWVLRSSDFLRPKKLPLR